MIQIFSSILLLIAFMPLLQVLAQVPTPIADEQDETITVETELVNLHVRVNDESKRPVLDLIREEFAVFEDGAPQPIIFFSREQMPITYGIVIANTSSVQAQIGKLIGVGRTIIESNRIGDEAFIARFEPTRRARIRWDFTTDKAALFRTLDELHTRSRATTLYDCLYLSADYIARRGGIGEEEDTLRRRALVVITDGEDSGSHYKPEQLLAALREKDVQLYVINFVDDVATARGSGWKDSRERRRTRSRFFLEQLARETGGRAFFPRSAADLPVIAQEVTRDLRTQYVIGYRPTNRRRDGAFRNVRVTITTGKERRSVITRPGYRAARGDEKQ